MTTREVPAGRVIAMVTLVTMGSVLPVFLLGANGPTIMADLGFGSRGIGFAAGSYTAGLAVASLLLGRWLDPLPVRLAVLFSLALVALGGIATAMAPSLSVLSLWLFVSGVGSSAIQMAGGRILSQLVTSASHGTAFGWFQSAKPIAVALAGGFGILAVWGLPWRWTFLLVVVFTVILGLFLSSSASTGTFPAQKASRDTVPQGPVLLLAALMGVGFALTNISTTFVPDTVARSQGSEGIASALLVIGGLLAALGRVLAGQLTDRNGWDELRLVAPAYILAGTGCLLVARGSQWGIVMGCVVIFAFGWAFGGLLVAKGTRLHPANSAAVIGQLLLGGAVGGTIAPPIFGGAAAVWGYGCAWTGFGALLLALGLGCLRLAGQQQGSSLQVGR